jgi:tetratricopeptide (TPR) repeat protein
VDLLAIYPHAHYLGTLLEAYATLPGGQRESLIRIPHWDLNWQSVYRYQRPLFLPRGTTISMRFHYDNSSANPRNPNHPPRRVRAGNEARDEMSHLWLQILPRGAGDHRRPIQEAVLRHRIGLEPRDAIAHQNLGALLLSKLDAQGAATEFRSAIQLDDTHPEAHDMLGAALLNTGRLQDAIAEFRKALEMNPQFLNADYNLALALAKTGDTKGALTHLRAVAAAFPKDERIQNQYRALQAKAGGSEGTAR